MAGPNRCDTSGCDVCLPCPCADILTDNLEPSVAIALLGNPKLRRIDRYRKMQQLQRQSCATTPRNW